MILADTSLWIEHFRGGVRPLAEATAQGRIVMHRFVVGELACGNLPNRARVLGALNDLPQCVVAEHDVVLELIESKRLMGRGLGWVDAHLLASAYVSRHTLWTLDRPLAKAAKELGLAAAL